MKSFKYWEEQEIWNIFSVNRVDQLTALDTWMSSTMPISAKTLDRIADLALLAKQEVDYWNEEELKILFVGPVMELVDFRKPRSYRVFFDRVLEGEVGDKELNGVVDMMVASGVQTPVEPFFFLQEYKPEKKNTTDPAGQLMAAMLVAQAKNADINRPLYGCYVNGRNWFFLLLKGKEYAISDALDITNKDKLAEVWMRLKYVKNKIEEYLSKK
jgi:hypothetical protein